MSLANFIDMAQVADTSAKLAKRRKGRRSRGIRLGVPAVAVSLAALLLDQVIALAWAFAGSAALAAVMFALDRVIDERIQRRWVESQLRDLRTAVAESGATVERLNRRELALNLTRSIRGLAPLILALSTLVEPPLS